MEPQNESGGDFQAIVQQVGEAQRSASRMILFGGAVAVFAVVLGLAMAEEHDSTYEGFNYASAICYFIAAGGAINLLIGAIAIGVRMDNEATLPRPQR